MMGVAIRAPTSASASNTLPTLSPGRPTPVERRIHPARPPAPGSFALTCHPPALGSARAHSWSPIVFGVAALAILGETTTLAGGGGATTFRVEPARVVLEGEGARQQLAALETLGDGSGRDLTAEARYVVEPPELAEVSASGVVSPRADGSGRLVVEAGGRSVALPITVGGTDATNPPSYRLDVVPLLSKAGCNAGACHGNLNGKGGFKLSLRGEDPASDYLALTRDSLGRRVDRARPEASLVVLKPTAAVSHEGGLRFEAGSPEARLLHDWIAAGAADDSATAPSVVNLTISPPDRRLAPDSEAGPSYRQQLVVTAEFADGSRRDVTRQVAYEINDPTRAEVSAAGLITSDRTGEVVVSARYLDARGSARLAFLADRPDFAWEHVEPKNALDVHVFAKLKSLRIKPSPAASDAAFLRRAYLDAIGVLPTAEEARDFLDDTDPEKRPKLVDRLLERPEFADFWALKWADLLRVEETVMDEKGVWIFNRWLREQVAADVPLDEFARAIVTATGSTWQNPPANFYRTNRDPETAAEALGQVFLGVRLQCARCHNHPYDNWTQDDYYGLSAFFANVRRKHLDESKRDKFDKHEINGDELIYLQGRAGMTQPRSGARLDPKPLGAPAVVAESDALDALADWLTTDNPQFARNLANRVWFHLMGRGVVDPVDDFRESNPPSNPALLDALTAEFVAGEMRLKPLVALIMKSAAYERSSTPDSTNLDDEANFARATVRLLPAEVLLDAIGRALDAPERFRSAPRGARAVQLAGTRGGGFLKAFGKPGRLLTCECERSDATTLTQAFQLINGEDVREKLEAPENRIGRLMDSEASDETILSELYLAALTRDPTAAESEAALQHVRPASDRRKGWEDVAWALLNSKEFLLRH